jgi:hypothetical protein
LLLIPSLTSVRISVSRGAKPEAPEGAQGWSAKGELRVERMEGVG